jgi:CrcB protein
LGVAWPDAHHQLPVTTLVINLTGSLLLGMLIVALTESWSAHPLLRPFLGTGVLGGYTTFSTFALQVRELSGGDATAYLLLSVVGGVLAAAAGMILMRRLKPATTGRRDTVDVIDPDLP